MLGPPGASPAIQEEDILRLHALFYGGIDPEHARTLPGRPGCSSPARNMSHPHGGGAWPYNPGWWRKLNKRRDAMHPVLLAAYAHRRLVDIHPFQEDGNGRTARLLIDLILVNRGYCGLIHLSRHDYYRAPAGSGPKANDTPLSDLFVSVNWRPRRTTAGCSASNSGGGKTPGAITVVPGDFFLCPETPINLRKFRAID